MQALLILATIVGNFIVVGDGIDNSSDILNGTTGPDTITGDVFDPATPDTEGDTINGLAGDDTIYGDTGPGDDPNWDTTDVGSGDTIDGGADADTIYGGAGGDFIHGGTGNDVIHGMKDIDALDGDDGDDILYGEEDRDTVNGGIGDDTIYGGDGNDTLVGSGPVYPVYNEIGADVIYGGEGDDIMYGDPGNDTLYGEAGLDYLYGGTGNDLLYGGADNDVMNGEDGNDYLDGGPGTDSMAGSGGNDSYVLTAGDSISEGYGGGVDTVRAPFSYTLLSNFENLVLIGTAQINGSGNALANAITGNPAVNVLRGLDGADALNGAAGSDTLYGGTGGDRFVFSTALGSTNVDVLPDFAPGSGDTIRLSRAVFTKLPLGTLPAGAFKITGIGAGTVDTTDRIIYNRDTGKIYYDRDGKGGAGAVLFARARVKLGVKNTNFVAY